MDTETTESSSVTKKKTEPDDMLSIFVDSVSSISLFLFIIVFILYILLDSTVWNEVVLGRFGLSEGGIKTSKGTIISALVVGIIVSVSDAMHKVDWI